MKSWMKYFKYTVTKVKLIFNDDFNNNYILTFTLATNSLKI